MHMSLSEIFGDADKGEAVRVVLWHGAGDAFCAGNDMGVSSIIHPDQATSRRAA